MSGTPFLSVCLVFFLVLVVGAEGLDEVKDTGKVKRSLDYNYNHGWNGGYQVESYNPYQNGDNDGKDDVNVVNYSKDVPVLYPVINYVHYPIVNKILYPVPVEQTIPIVIEKPVPHPVVENLALPVEKKILEPVPVEKKVPVHYPVEKNVFYPVQVEKKIPVPYKVEKEIRYPVIKNVPYPVHIEKKVPFPVLYPVHVEKKVEVPYPVIKPVPYLVPVEKQIPVHYPVKVETKVPVHVPVEKHVPYPVHIEKEVKVPVPIIKKVPYPVPVEKEVKVPYPAHATSTQQFSNMVNFEKKIPNRDLFKNFGHQTGSQTLETGSQNTFGSGKQFDFAQSHRAGFYIKPYYNYQISGQQKSTNQLSSYEGSGKRISGVGKPENYFPYGIKRNSDVDSEQNEEQVAEESQISHDQDRSSYETQTKIEKNHQMTKHHHHHQRHDEEKSFKPWEKVD
ncbi:Repetitive proline-rich cell wall protein precursor, putative [Pediculus humanus corporis]|uniref:Repetitive proline-rich cell wall protein, putative n=1 Tax=Pediculus humanus subsp. corporis TaxID=121224 RepID=E0VDB1_PEDHC|nr:Repetitive proline-rich cell wall protein precursor, putative [Pediculus humanus corporis]EEB11367.1 Repetitive proline-rich cell wall protein precursor, putative [Pediculus humanus corporis]